MSVPTFPPRKDVDLLNWSANFLQKISAQPKAVGLTPQQVSAYSALHSVWAEAYAVANSPNTNAKANVTAKDNARQRLLEQPNGARELVKIVQAHPGTTNDMRAQLGLRMAKKPSQVGPPRAMPTLSVVMTQARIVKVRLRDNSTPDKRGKPDGVLGATVLYSFGDEMPEKSTQWIFARNASRPVFDVEIPECVAAGTKVWLTASWFNKRMQCGPMAEPAFTRAVDGVALDRKAA